MKTRTKLRSLAVLILLLSLASSVLMFAGVRYIDEEFALKSREEVESANLVEDPEELKQVIRSAYKAVLAVTQSMSTMVSDLAWVFAVIALISAFIIFVARKVRD